MRCSTFRETPSGCPKPSLGSDLNVSSIPRRVPNKIKHSIFGNPNESFEDASYQNFVLTCLEPPTKKRENTLSSKQSVLFCSTHQRPNALAQEILDYSNNEFYQYSGNVPSLDINTTKNNLAQKELLGPPIVGLFEELQKEKLKPYSSYNGTQVRADFVQPFTLQYSSQNWIRISGFPETATQQVLNSCFRNLGTILQTYWNYDALEVQYRSSLECCRALEYNGAAVCGYILRVYRLVPQHHQVTNPTSTMPKERKVDCKLHPKICPLKTSLFAKLWSLFRGIQAALCFCEQKLESFLFDNSELTNC